MIPHMARALVGADYGRLIPASAMLGATYLVLMDDLARSLLSMELPLGVVTSIMGAPFLYLLSFRKGVNDMLLQLQNVSGGYGKGDIVKNVSCEADEGDILCLAGPNGCGKPLCSV